MGQLFPTAGQRARPIEGYGLLGDTRTAALVGSDGAIDWLCVPRFDGQPVFGRLVGGPAAGSFGMGPAGAAPVITRRYRPHTATLATTWDTPGGRLTLTEGMIADVTGRLLPSSLLVRRLTAPDGPVEAVIEFDPHLGHHHQHCGACYRRTGGSQSRTRPCRTNWPSIEAGVHLLAPTKAGRGAAGVVADIAKLSVGREAYSTRELATDHEQYLSGHGESPGRTAAMRRRPFDAVGFDHRTSREGDPLLHTHLVVANRSRGRTAAGRRWTAGTCIGIGWPQTP
jgi:hypothetical protein